MSAPSDDTFFASHFDFDSSGVSVQDLIVHLRTMGMEPEGIGLVNAMASLAAADLLASAFDGLQTLDWPGYLLKRLQNVDSNTWGEVQ